MKFAKVCSSVLSKTDVVARVAERAPLIDAAGPGRKVYQVTISPDHDLPLSAAESLCQELGYIDKHGKIVPEDAVGKLEFYWVVPIGLASRWKEKTPFKYKLGNKASQKKDHEPFFD